MCGCQCGTPTKYTSEQLSERAVVADHQHRVLAPKVARLQKIAKQGPKNSHPLSYLCMETAICYDGLVAWTSECQQQLLAVALFLSVHHIHRGASHARETDNDFS